MSSSNVSLFKRPLVRFLFRLVVSRMLATSLGIVIGLLAFTTSAAVVGTKTALVMLVSLNDAPIDCTVAEVNGLFFTNSPLNVDSFYEHSTWGNLGWSGNVIAVSINYSTSPCNADAWANAADAQALQQGYNPNSYSARVYALPSAAGSCGYAFASGNRVWNFHCSDLFAYGHEVGHTVGLNHASTDHNNDGVIENEYGGWDDCMGGESYTFNAPHKIWGGWLPERASEGGWRQATADGTYLLGPLEVNPASHPPYTQALKIIPPTGPPYFLSYRQPLDFDQGWTPTQVGKDGRSGTSVDPVPPISSYTYAKGATIHRFSGGTGDHTLEIAVLADNQQFTLPGTGIVIQQNSHDSSRVSVDIRGFEGGTAPLGVTFYQDTLFGGSQSQVLGAGDYTLSQMAAKGVPNDWASSCKIPAGWTLLMYQDFNLSGPVWNLTADVSDFTNLSPNGNDQMSSCRILAGPALPPSVPTELSVTPGNSQARLSWTATPGATGYTVKRATSSVGPYQSVGNPAASAFVDVGLANGNTYYFKVSATNNIGGSSDAGPVSVSPTSDLVARWKLDESGGGTAADSSGNNNTGTLLNTPTWVTPGRLGPSALSFNAASLESVTVANSSSLNSPVTAITIAAWVNAADWNGNRRILQKGNSDNQYRFLAEGGLFKLDLRGVDTLTAPLPPTGIWVHLAATWDGSTMILYTNGIQQVSQGAGGTIATTTDPLAIAKKNGSGVSGDYFNGKLDDVRIYNRALSAAEVVTIMTNSPPVFVSNFLRKPDASAGQAYIGTVATDATDSDGDAITFSKVSGPAWLDVADNGGLSGTPLSIDRGTNTFVLSAMDSGNLANTATMIVNVIPAPPIAAMIQWQGTDLRLGWSGGIPPYQVYMTTNLVDAAWHPLGQLDISTNMVLIPSNAASFYQVLGQ